MNKPTAFKRMHNATGEGASLTLPRGHALLNPSLRIGADQNHIELREGKVFYHNVDITKDFLELINSGYLDRFLPKIEAEFDEV